MFSSIGYTALGFISHIVAKPANYYSLLILKRTEIPNLRSFHQLTSLADLMLMDLYGFWCCRKTP